MSKRMIHYHFGDKKGLYQRCLVLAIKQLRPTITEMELDSEVPVDGVQKIDSGTRSTECIVHAVFLLFHLYLAVCAFRCWSLCHHSDAHLSVWLLSQ